MGWKDWKPETAASSAEELMQEVDQMHAEEARDAAEHKEEG